MIRNGKAARDRLRRKLDLGPVLADRRTRIVVTCGSGGVGKTTTAAAMALWAADAGRKVAVLTIDPAKRLAQSLGLEELDNDPRRVDVQLADADGELWAMMLDTRRTFDEMVATHSTPDTGRRHPGEPVLQGDLHLVLRHPGVHGDGEAVAPWPRRTSST